MDVLRMITIFCTISFATINSKANLDFRLEDRIRIKEAIKISKIYGDAIWKGFNKSPFTIVLVTDRYEYLINHPSPTDDYKYISFQWYQEGIARYTEYAFLRLLQDFEPSKEVLNLKDFVAYEVYLKEFYTRHLENVKKMKLSKEKRITVYDIGFAEALVIEHVNKDWKDKYLIEKFDLKKLYD
ncbi:hypothetical protein [uncultured Tenacibaculum sp.]|uniref:hypothetical protein n=1 Tax=uncultured Tenacibaculum sp. TaxID=174713 RepID=UPI0026337AC3|nr:hypothetical protein [uncultured Tenacibaculum sp.]